MSSYVLAGKYATVYKLPGKGPMLRTCYDKNKTPKSHI